MASIEPTTHAAIARGKRKRQTNSPWRLEESCKAANHSGQPNETEPVALAKNILPIDSNSNKKSSDRRNDILQD
jgi:hypothetical protein